MADDTLSTGDDTVAGEDTIQGNDTVSGADTVAGGGEDTAAAAQGGDDTLGGSGGEVTPDWPDDWRDKASGGDEKLAKVVERYRSVPDMAKALAAAQQKIRSGELRPTLTDNASDEEVAEYRKAHGIPESPEGYLENLPDGLVVGDEDKEAVNSFLKSVHGKNASPDVVASALDWYYKQQDEAEARQTEADKEYRQKANDELRAEWGTEYRSNINAIASFLDAAPSDEEGNSLKDLLFGARLADGTPLGDNPAAMRWLAQVAHESNPGHFVSPGVGGQKIEAIEDEIKSIEGKMGTPEYTKDEKMQERLRTLYAAQEKLKARAA